MKFVFDMFILYTVPTMVLPPKQVRAVTLKCAEPGGVKGSAKFTHESGEISTVYYLLVTVV